MPKHKRSDNYLFNLILLIAAFAITAFCTLTSAYTQDGHNLKVGDVSDRRFNATRKVENTVATERNRKEAEKAAADMKPIRKKEPEIDESVMKSISDLFIKLDDIRTVYQTELIHQAEAEREAAKTPETTEPAEPTVSEHPEPDKLWSNAHNDSIVLLAYNIGMTSGNLMDINDPLMPLTAMEQIDKLQLTLSDSQSRLLLNMDDEHYEELNQAVRQALENVLEQGVQDVDARSLLNIQDELSKIDITSEMRNIAYQIASEYLTPNLIIDEATTAAARQEIASQYEVKYMLKDQTIVDQGQIISLEEYELLDTLGLISDGLQNTILPMVASFILEAVLFILTVAYIKLFCHKVFENRKESALLFSIYFVTIAATRLLIKVPYQFLPILLFTMLVAMLINLRLSIVLNIFVSIIAMMICNGSIEFLVFFTITGLAVSLLSKYTTERNHVFIVGIVACILSFMLMFLISLFFQRTYSPNILQDAGYAAGNGILTVIVCLGSLPFWEAFFGVITNIKLLDLTNPNSTLLRRLIIEAPGTYHHSLVVANLSETAAYEIGADANLARVGGYYHDIGKLKNPQFFTENQDLMSESPHKGLTPLESVHIIIEHVRYGIELAGEFKLPQVIKDFILQHHGNTLIQYFYCKAKEEGEAVNESDYRYPFSIPQSKETAILMLADTAEAAVRSKKKDFKDFNELECDIKRLIKLKLDDGQLLDSGLSIKDLELIAIAFMRVFKGMFHERIEYPKMEEPSAGSEVSAV